MSEIQAKFENEIDLITNKNRTMSIIGLREMVERDLRKEFKGQLKSAAEKMLKKGMSIKDITSCISLSAAEVRKLAKQVIANV
jgi:hypothetical protein